VPSFKSLRSWVFVLTSPPTHTPAYVMINRNYLRRRTTSSAPIIRDVFFVKLQCGPKNEATPLRLWSPEPILYLWLTSTSFCPEHNCHCIFIDFTTRSGYGKTQQTRFYSEISRKRLVQANLLAAFRPVKSWTHYCFI